MVMLDDIIVTQISDVSDYAVKTVKACRLGILLLINLNFSIAGDFKETLIAVVAD
jgi:hypothetical protein